MALPRIRTIAEAFNEVKAADPGTAITYNYVRRLIVSRAVPSVMAGSKYLVDMDRLEEYLCNPDRQEIDRVREYNAAQSKIRAVR